MGHGRGKEQRTRLAGAQKRAMQDVRDGKAGIVLSPSEAVQVRQPVPANPAEPTAAKPPYSSSSLSGPVFYGLVRPGPDAVTGVKPAPAEEPYYPFRRRPGDRFSGQARSAAPVQPWVFRRMPHQETAEDKKRYEVGMEVKRMLLGKEFMHSYDRSITGQRANAVVVTDVMREALGRILAEGQFREDRNEAGELIGFSYRDYSTSSIMGPYKSYYVPIDLVEGRTRRGDSWSNSFGVAIHEHAVAVMRERKAARAQTVQSLTEVSDEEIYEGRKVFELGLDLGGIKIGYESGEVVVHFYGDIVDRHGNIYTPDGKFTGKSVSSGLLVAIREEVKRIYAEQAQVRGVDAITQQVNRVDRGIARAKAAEQKTQEAEDPNVVRRRGIIDRAVAAAGVYEDPQWQRKFERLRTAFIESGAVETAIAAAEKLGINFELQVDPVKLGWEELSRVIIIWPETRLPYAFRTGFGGDKKFDAITSKTLTIAVSDQPEGAMGFDFLIEEKGEREDQNQEGIWNPHKDSHGGNWVGRLADKGAIRRRVEYWVETARRW